MSIDSLSVLLSKYAKYPVIALISIVVGIVSYDFTKDVVRATGYSLIFIGLPLLLMALIDIGIRGINEYLIKRVVDFSVITFIGFILSSVYNKKASSLGSMLFVFFLIVILWVLLRKGIEYLFKESNQGYVIIDLTK